MPGPVPSRRQSVGERLVMPRRRQSVGERLVMPSHRQSAGGCLVLHRHGWQSRRQATRWLADALAVDAMAC